jgi:hypothetical protein
MLYAKKEYKIFKKKKERERKVDYKSSSNSQSENEFETDDSVDDTSETDAERFAHNS